MRTRSGLFTDFASPALTSPISLSDGGEGISQVLSTITTSGNINALAPTTGRILMTGATPVINGIVAPSPAQARELTLIFTGTNLTFNHQNGSASASDRIIGLAASTTKIYNGQTITLVYDTTASRWRIHSTSGPAFSAAASIVSGGVLTSSDTVGGLVTCTPVTIDGSGNVTSTTGIGSFLTIKSPSYVNGVNVEWANGNSFRLFEPSSAISVDFGSHYLYSSGTVSIDWANKILQDNSAVPSVNYLTRELYDSMGSVSIDYINRQLVTPFSYSVLSWSGAQISFDNASTNTYGNVGTITNAPSAGNPIEWMSVLVSGNVRYIPLWS